MISEFMLNIARSNNWIVFDWPVATKGHTSENNTVEDKCYPYCMKNWSITWQASQYTLELIQQGEQIHETNDDLTYQVRANQCPRIYQYGDQVMEGDAAIARSN